MRPLIEPRVGMSPHTHAHTRFLLPVTARGNEVAPAREDTEKEHARKRERRTQHGNQRGGRPREDAVLPLRGQAAKGWCNQLEDGRHDPFPPYLGPSGK